MEQLGSKLESRQEGKDGITYVTKNAGCIFDDAFEVGSVLSRLGLTVGKIGGDGPCLAMSAETRSFSGSVPILILEI